MDYMPQLAAFKIVPPSTFLVPRIKAHALLFSFFHQEDLGGEVVAVAVEEDAGAVGAEGVSLAVAFLGL